MAAAPMVTAAIVTAAALAATIIAAMTIAAMVMGAGMALAARGAAAMKAGAMWDRLTFDTEPQLFCSDEEHFACNPSRSSFGCQPFSRSRICARPYKLVARNTAVHLRAAAFARRSASRRIVLQYLLPSLTVNARLASSLTAGSTAGCAARGTRQ